MERVSRMFRALFHRELSPAEPVRPDYQRAAFMAFALLRMYVCLHAANIWLFAWKSPNSVSWQVLNSSPVIGAGLNYAMGVCIVIIFLDTLVNDFLPDKFQLLTFKNYRYLVFIALAIVYCSALVVIIELPNIATRWWGVALYGKEVLFCLGIVWVGSRARYRECVYRAR